MIAACAPSLKPLVSSALKLSGYSYGTSRTPGNYGGRYGGSNRYASNYSGRITSSRPRPPGWRDQYGLEELQSSDRHSDEIQLKGDPGNYSATATFYNVASSGSDENHESRSDDRADWPRRRDNNADRKGDIMLTTEVIVQ